MDEGAASGKTCSSCFAATAALRSHLLAKAPGRAVLLHCKGVSLVVCRADAVPRPERRLVVLLPERLGAARHAARRLQAAATRLLLLLRRLLLRRRRRLLLLLWRAPRRLLRLGALLPCSAAVGRRAVGLLLSRRGSRAGRRAALVCLYAALVRLRILRLLRLRLVRVVGHRAGGAPGAGVLFGSHVGGALISLQPASYSRSGRAAAQQRRRRSSSAGAQGGCCNCCWLLVMLAQVGNRLGASRGQPCTPPPPLDAVALQPPL